jgi:hypothetical protein
MRKRSKKITESEEIIDSESEENIFCANSDATDSQKANQKKHIECECGKQFSSKKKLQHHENSVHSEVKKVFQCEFCDLKLSRKDKLKSHKEKVCQFFRKGREKSFLQKAKIETVHEKKKRFECECGKKFAERRGLQRHENSAHAKVKKVFQCQFFDLKLSRKDRLKTHQEKVCQFAKKGKEKSKKA